MKFKHAFSALFLALLLTSTSFAKTEHYNLTIGTNRVVFFEFVKAKNAKLPTFLFMPGVNRGLLAEDEALENLAGQGFGVVTMNFSTQPISVSEMPAGVKPHFRTTTYKLDDFNTEVTALSEELKKNFGVKTVVPVSISFSGAVSSSLQNFPLIIDAVPMTSSAAVNPELEAYITYLKSGEIFNPVFGPSITRSILDQAYAQKWSSQVDSITEQFGLNKDRRADMIEGYSVGSRASERFEWDLKKTSADTRRIFIFAKDDSPALLKSQLEVFSKALETTPNAIAFLVNDSGHIVSDDQPEAYASILNFVSNPANIKNVSGIYDVKSGADRRKLYTGPEAKKYIKEVLNSL